MKACNAGHGLLTNEKASILAGKIGKLNPEKVTSEQMVEAVEQILEKLCSLVQTKKDQLCIKFPGGELWVSPLSDSIILRRFDIDTERTLSINYPISENHKPPFNKPYAQYTGGIYSSIKADYERQSSVYADAIYFLPLREQP